MFPKTFDFVGTPLQLQRAVENLPEPKGRIRHRSSSRNSLREKLLQLDPTQLKQWKMKSTMLRLVPDLAVETNNAALRERVLAITQGSLSNMDYGTLQRLIPFVWMDQETRLAINAHFVRKPPKGGGWLSRYYKSFRVEDPALHIAESIGDSVHLYELHIHLKMQTSNPLFIEICSRFCMGWSMEMVRSWRWPTLLQWLGSGYPRPVRVQVFQWVLQEYTHQFLDNTSLSDGTPLFELLHIGLQITTQEDRSSMEVHQQRWLRQVYHAQLLERWASRQVLKLWSRWMTHVEAIDIHRPSGWLFLHLHEHVVIHSMVHTGQEMHIVSQSHFRQSMVTLLRQPTPFSITKSRATVTMESEWSIGLSEWMQSQGYVPMNEHGVQ